MRAPIFHTFIILISFATVGVGQGVSSVKQEMETASNLARQYQVSGVNDKAVYYGLKALDLARQSKNNRNVVNALLKISSIESDAGFYDRSIKRLLEVEEIDTSSNRLQRMSWPYARLFIGMGAPRLALERLVKFPGSQFSEIAKLYTMLGVHDSAVYYYRKLWVKNPEELHNNNNLGIAFAGSNNLDSGLYYYQKALELSTSGNFMHGMISGNIGALYSKNNMYEEAVPYLEVDFEISEQVKEYEIHVNVGELLYRAYVNTGKNKWAKEVLQNMLLYKSQVNISSKLAIARVELLHYRGKEKGLQYDKRLKRYEKLNAKHLKSIQDKVQATAEVLSAYRIKQIETDKTVLNQQLTTQQNEKKQAQLRNGLIIMGLLSLSIIIVAFFLRYRVIQKKNALLREVQLIAAEKEQEILALKVKEENRSVQELSLELITKKDFSETVLKKLREFEQVSKSDLLNMEMFIQNELDIKSPRAALQDQMGELSSNFYSELKLKHPSLTDLDLKLAGMIAMKMTNKEIAISKNITPASVKKTKTRLKQKLNLQYEDDLTDFLKRMI